MHRFLRWRCECLSLRLILLLPLALLCASGRTHASLLDTTITAFVKEPIDIAHRTVTRNVLFPGADESYRRIVMYYTIECPAYGCDPWDRVATVTVTRHTAKGADELYELARIITPQGRGATWGVDVTDYRSLLTDSVTMNCHIETFIGGGQGALVSVAFRFVPGIPDLEAYRVENLWAGLPEYGNPQKPIEDLLRPIGLKADSEMEFARVRVTTTGHGEGNTDDAAAFSKKHHDLIVGKKTFSHLLWRDDCADNPVAPQSGDWQSPRAGYCPGAVVEPWDNDISGLIEPGELFTIDYDVEPYENRCRPGVAPCPCENCDYVTLSHSMPIYWIESQIIYYRIPLQRRIAEQRSALFTVASGSVPGVFVVRPTLTTPTDLEIQVVDLLGNEIFYQLGRHVTSEPFTIDLSSTPGTYLLKIVPVGGDLFEQRIVIR